MPILNWLDRDKDIKAAEKVPYRLLEVDPDLSYGDDPNSQNMLIQGDNLEALKALLPYYAGQVKCIYIDPPYNTGSAFEHYDDNLEHSIWLSMMYPRLELLRDFLSEDGYLAVQIDDNEFAHLYLILAELFGSKNLKVISVKMSEATGVKMASVNKSGTLAKLKEYIILAGKNGIKNLDVEKIPKQNWDYEYKNIVLGATQEELNNIKTILNDDDRSELDIEYTDRILSQLTFKNANEISKKERGKKADEEWLFKNAWRIVQFATLTGGAKDLAIKKKKQLEDGRNFSITTAKNKMYAIRGDFNHETNLPRCKFLFADMYLEVHPGDFWQDIKTTGLDNEGSVDFSNGKKPERLIKRIIKMCSSKNDLILDSFLGSGTTAAVSLKLNRRFIGVEMGKQAKTHSAHRLREVIDGEQGGISKEVDWKGGGSFKFYRLGEAVFDEDGHITKGIKFEHLAAHVWFSETKTALNGETQSPLLGVHNGTAYYLLYNGILGDKKPQGGNVLTTKILESLPPHDGAKVIYGESCRLGNARLKKENIVFKQTPYDVKAR